MQNSTEPRCPHPGTDSVLTTLEAMRGERAGTATYTLLELEILSGIALLGAVTRVQPTPRQTGERIAVCPIPKGESK